MEVHPELRSFDDGQLVVLEFTGIEAAIVGKALGREPRRVPRKGLKPLAVLHLVVPLTEAEVEAIKRAGLRMVLYAERYEVVEVEPPAPDED